MLRLALTVSALALCAGPAFAEALPGPGATYREHSLGSAQERDRHTVPLRKGQDYAIGGSADQAANVTVRDPKGRTVAQFAIDLEIERGREIRPKTSGLYTIEVRAHPIADTYPQSYWFRVQTACTGGKLTQCNLKPGGSFSGAMSFNQDFDMVRLETRAGHSYTLGVDANGVSVEVLDSKGRLLAGERDAYLFDPTAYTFKAPAGTVFARVIEQDDGGGPYKLSLR